MMRLNKLVVLVLVLFCCHLTVSAQQITGKVTAVDGTPLIGVNISVKETNTGTISESTGAFQIVASPGNTLVFSYIGFATYEVTLGNEKILDVTLKEDAQSLTEVVVTALGVQRESKKLGYSVTAVNTAQLLQNRTTNVMESLEGRVAGLNITPPCSGCWFEYSDTLTRASSICWSEQCSADCHQRSSD